MALNILSIPPLSNKIKGVFSGVRRSIPWERASLHMDTVEVQELTGNWNINGLLHEEASVMELLNKVAAIVVDKEQQNADKNKDEDDIRMYKAVSDVEVSI